MPNVLGLGSRQSSARGAAGGVGGGGGLGEMPGANSGPSRTGTPLSQRTSSLRGEREGSRRGQTPPMPQQPEEKYIVYLRFPFARNGFVDPPQVDWDAGKESASHLQVSRAFLLQQAAWLYERELSQIQAQMRKAGLNTNLGFPTPPSPRPQSPAVMGGVPMTRTGTAGTADLRVHSSLSVRSNPITTPTPRATPLPPTPTTATRPVAQPISRTGSARTATQVTTAHRLSSHVPAEPSRIPSPTQRPSSSEVSEEEIESSTTGSSDDDDDDDDDTNQPPRRLQGFLKKNRGMSSDEDDGDDEPAFLPFASTEKPSSVGEANMTGTVVLPRRRMAGGMSGKGKEVNRSVTSPAFEAALKKKVPAAMGSPRKFPVTDSAGPSSPSMGSSFSDLSDASVTQSAMEDAYLSTMQAGGMGSRMSSLSQAVRSRYFPTSN
ncbi:hypothetical protein L873DRAFT_1667225 [Choiromyces venosus 120613-1]|uniref:Autophagy-related protein 29 n=1 Tax=Choiromyces venosus 120613-1 TaxID=1336337 RepID=A0A3N4K0H0_9PEZI|nr:hypothetical protein L873DRAFT_1667225 [Choiromyces venosus 120613-1]